jgi:putative ABC transport system permease protein
MIIFQFALRNLRRHWIRSFLSVIGIIIGVFAIAALGIMGNSINLLVANLVSDVGDTLVVSPHVAVSTGITGDPRTLVEATITPEQVNQIERIAGAHDVIPVVQSSAEINYGDSSGNARIIGLDPEDIPILLEVAEGQFLKQNSPGCLVGSYLADEFDIKAGSRIRINEQYVRVVGVLEERGWAADINADLGVVVSKRWFGDNIGDEDAYAMVIIKLQNIDDLGDVKEALDHQMNRREDTVDLYDSRDLIAQYDDYMDMMTKLLLSIGSVSLLIASVNILNVMYISVTERIHEIGILRSIGTLKNEILRMFLYEAAILGVIGSIIGAILSVIGGYLVSIVAIQAFTAGTTFGENAVIFNATSVSYIVFATFFGIFLSALSGMYPAWKAAQLTPIEALRHD